MSVLRPPLLWAYNFKAKPICLRLFWQLARRAASRAACTAGSKRPTAGR